MALLARGDLCSLVYQVNEMRTSVADLLRLDAGLWPEGDLSWVERDPPSDKLVVLEDFFVRLGAELMAAVLRKLCFFAMEYAVQKLKVPSEVASRVARVSSLVQNQILAANGSVGKS